MFLAATEQGRDRHHSQDRVFVDEARCIGAVLDGHGARGRVAEMLIEALRERLDALPPAPVAREQIREIVVESVSAVFDAASADRRLRGAGTTLDLVSLHGAAAWIAHAGDGRVYHVSGDSVRQVTADHTWVAEAVARGEITRDDAASHPLRNVITRAVGVVEDTVVDSVEMSISAGDYLIACTDAIWREDGEAFVIESCRLSSPQAIVDALLYCPALPLGRQARCSDDASVLVATV